MEAHSHSQTTGMSAPIFASYLRLFCICALFLYSLPFPEDWFSFPVQERGEKERGGEEGGPHSGQRATVALSVLLMWPKQPSR